MPNKTLSLLAALTLSTAALAESATRPSTAATTSSPSTLATPSELYEQIKARLAAKKSATNFALIDLDAPITERPAAFSLFGGSGGETLHDLLGRLEKARTDGDVRGVLLNIGTGFGINFAQAQEIRTALDALRQAGKRVFVYADGYDTTSYLVASAASDICLLGGGEVFMPGVSIETMFYRGAMDKVGVQPDFVQIGEFKGAEEPYMNKEPSRELRGEMNKLVDALHAQIVQAISSSRNISQEAASQVIDDAIVSAEQAKSRGLIDHVIDIDGLRDLIGSEVGGKVELLHGYGEADTPELDFTNPLVMLSQIMRKPAPSTRPAVAVIYADGVISDGSGDGGLFGESGVGSDSMRNALRIADRDEQVKAIVLRIDSPGGSALASEAMWQAIRRVGAKKPIVVSIGGMAASGGYYLASASDTVYADPAAIVGSIGVVGGKFVLKGLYDWAGLTTEQFSRGRNADLYSQTKPWDERQKRLVRNWMRNTYDQFTSRVMTTRTGKIKDIDQVARGRIFLARDAQALGMVDHLGGLNAALNDAAGKANLELNAYDVKTLPAPLTLGDLLRGNSPSGVRSPLSSIGADSPLLLLPPSARQLIGRQFQLGQLLQKRPVVLMSPFILQTR